MNDSALNFQAKATNKPKQNISISENGQNIQNKNSDMQIVDKSNKSEIKSNKGTTPLLRNLIIIIIAIILITVLVVVIVGIQLVEMMKKIKKEQQI